MLNYQRVHPFSKTGLPNIFLMSEISPMQLHMETGSEKIITNRGVNIYVSGSVAMFHCMNTCNSTLKTSFHGDFNGILISNKIWQCFWGAYKVGHKTNIAMENRNFDIEIKYTCV